MSSLRVLYCFVAAWLLVPGLLPAWGQADPTIIYLVRHAEKADDGTSDPPLTEQGQARADHLARMLATVGITHVHSTDYKRTRQTVEPLADRLGLSVESYDPGDLPGMAQTLRETPGVHVVSGHSNTTPVLVHLLGGDAGNAIDDAEYGRLYMLTLHDGGAVQTTLFQTPPFAEGPAPAPVVLDADHLVEAQDTYQMSYQGEPVGTSVWETRLEDEAVVLHEKTVLERFDVDADIEVHLDPASYAPRSMHMRGVMFGNESDIAVDWVGTRVLGHSQMARVPFKPQGHMTIDRVVPEGTLERSAALFLAAAMPFAEEPFAFTWFNTYDGELRTITVTLLGSETVTVPAGTFDTYRVAYDGGAPSQVFYITKETPRRVVKIEIVAQPWVYELIERTP